MAALSCRSFSGFLLTKRCFFLVSTSRFLSGHKSDKLFTSYWSDIGCLTRLGTWAKTFLATNMRLLTPESVSQVTQCVSLAIKISNTFHIRMHFNSFAYVFPRSKNRFWRSHRKSSNDFYHGKFINSWVSSHGIRCDVGGVWAWGQIMKKNGI